MYKILFFAASAIAVSSCGGGGSNSSAPSPVPTFSAAPAVIASDGAACPDAGGISISGTLQYERVPFSAFAGQGLDYNNIQILPIRGVQVQALGVGDCIISTATSSAMGSYSLSVAPNVNVKIRVKARLLNNAGATWDFEIRDNTRSNALYVIDGSSVSSGLTNSTRNLTAESGWTGFSYGQARAAAPFAILDSVYEAVQKVIAADATVLMDDADIFWSVNNSTANGTLANGEIGTSFYDNDQIYLVGLANSDTDEYDQHVVIHEWGHYFEDNLSRSDSIGGDHAVTDKLDLRVAFSEGFGNAFSGMVTDDPSYRDSSGISQAADFEVNVESNASFNIGWFNEGSVQTILYDIYDSVSDANDSLSLGFSPIYDAMTSANYRNQPSQTAIFSFMDELQNSNPGSLASLNALVNSQGIDNIIDQYGTGETNDGGDPDNLPVYQTLSDNGIPVTVCSSKANGEPNKLGAIRLVNLSVLTAGTHTIVATRTAAGSTLAVGDPDVRVYLNGSLVSFGVSAVANTETVTTTLNVDDYILDIREYTNTDSTDSIGNASGDICFDVSVS